MDILINGEIYIKNGSEPFHLNDKYRKIIHDLEFESSKENPSLVAMNFLDFFKKIEASEGTTDYSGCTDFWISTIDNNGIHLSYKLVGIDEPLERTFPNKKELDKSFTKLVDFLDSATYVGRYFKRTASLNGDRSYMLENNSVLVLYATNNMMLVRYTNIFGDISYKMISPNYLEDGKFSFYGDYTDQYKDKVAIYQAINQQLKNNRRGKSL